MDREAIVALATPPLRSALLVVRSSGAGVLSVLADLMGRPSVLSVQERTSFVGLLRDSEGRPLDQVVALAYPSGKSSTGEEVVEIIAHGNPLIGEGIIKAFLAKGARMAKPGEFTLRAFLNGKVDLVEAEAVNALIGSASEEGASLSLGALEGSSSKVLETATEAIASLLASIETSIDFPEFEDLDKDLHTKIVSETPPILKKLDDLVSQGKAATAVIKGVDVAIVGLPNVGKSSLLNALLGEERAIVTDIPGTTRDVVTGEIVHKGVPIRFLDTAGVRTSDDPVEQKGIQMGEEAIRKADVVLVVSDIRDGEEPVLPEGIRSPIIHVRNKADLAQKDSGGVTASALKGEVAGVLDAIVSVLSLDGVRLNSPALVSERQLDLVSRASCSLREAASLSEESAPLSLVALPVQEAYALLKEVLGASSSSDIEDEIFSRFCVGK